MAPIGRLHNSFVLRLNRIFSSLLSHQTIISVQSPVRLGKYAEPEPDIALLKLNDNFYATFLPTQEDVYLLVEVSETSLPFDQKTKMPMYAKHNIPEVWILDIESGTLDKYTRPDGNEYKTKKTYQAKDTISIDAFPEVQIKLNNIFPKSETR